MENYLSIDGVRIHYDECGDPGASPILLLHGWGCNLSTVASIRKIVEQRMRVISIDFPGHGKSDEPDSVWGIEEYTSMTEKFVRMLNIDNPILLGHSFGGRVSILYASRNNVSKVILVDAAGIKPARSLKYHIKIRWFKFLKTLIPAVCGKKRGHTIIDRLRKKAGSADYAAASPRMRAVLSKVVNEDLKNVMPQIKAPTLLVWGENDTATPLSDAKTMEKLIPDCGLVSFPGCGHYSFLDNPIGFRAVIKEFLKSEQN